MSDLDEAAKYAVMAPSRGTGSHPPPKKIVPPAHDLCHDPHCPRQAYGDEGRRTAAGRQQQTLGGRHQPQDA